MRKSKRKAFWEGFFIWAVLFTFSWAMVAGIVALISLLL